MIKYNNFGLALLCFATALSAGEREVKSYHIDKAPDFSRQLFVIGYDLQDKDILVDAFPVDANIIYIDKKDSIKDVAQKIEEYNNVETFHWLSHARPGEISLAGKSLSATEFAHSQPLLSALNTSLSSQADILFYGCELGKGKAGKDFINQVAKHTQRAVWASDDLTGNAGKGGDWILEVSSVDTGSRTELSAPEYPETLNTSVTPTRLDSATLVKPNSVQQAADGADEIIFTSKGYTFKVNKSPGDPAIHYSFDSGFAESGLNLANASISIKKTDSASPRFSFHDLKFFNDGFPATEEISVQGKLAGVVVAGPLTKTFGDLPKDAEDYNSISQLGSSGSLPAGFNNVDEIVITTTSTGATPTSGNYGLYFNSITTSEPPATPADTSATLTAGPLAEPTTLASTANASGNAVDLFDFTITDGGGADGFPVKVEQIKVNVAGSATDAQRAKITWRLNGAGASNVSGNYDSATDTLTFSGLNISIADSTSTTYKINGYFSSSDLLDNASYILTIDGDTDVTVASTGSTKFTTTNDPVSNGSGFATDVTATKLVFATQASGVVSGKALGTVGTAPVVNAVDGNNNVDTDFSEVVTIALKVNALQSSGTLTGTTRVTATNGVATFSGLIHTATEDTQGFQLTADDEDSTGTDLTAAISSLLFSDVVATKLVFDTQPAPLGVESGQAASFSTVPAVSARDANDLVDTDYATDIVLKEVNGAGSATMLMQPADSDGNSTTVTAAPVSGVATFSGMTLTYTASGGADENFNLLATSGSLTPANSNQMTAGSYDTDATVISAASVTEPVVLPSTTNSSAAPLAIFDFTIKDGGGADGKNTIVSQIKLHVSGTADASDLGFVLTGPDATNVAGTYSTGVLTFNGLNINVVDGSEETYEVGVYFIDNTGLTDGQTLILSTDGDADFTLGSTSTKMGSTTPVTNGQGSPIDITATRLVYTRAPSTAVSSLPLSPQPIVAAQDAFGNIDTDFTETITLTENSDGSLTGDADITAVNGVAMFTNVKYVATADQQSFTLSAGDTSFAGLLTAANEVLLGDVVATQLVFDTQPVPLVITAGKNEVFTTVPVVSAKNAQGQIDIDYVGQITLNQGTVNPSSTTALTVTGDIDSATDTVTLTASDGVATFTGLKMNYLANAATNTVTLKATDNVAGTSDTSSSTIDVNIAPFIQEATNSFGPLAVNEDVKTLLDTSDLIFTDEDGEAIALTLSVNKGLLFAVGGDGTTTGVTVAGSNDAAGSQSITYSGTGADLVAFFNSDKLEFQTALNDTSDVTLTLSGNDGITDSLTPHTETITINAINDAPTISGTPTTLVEEGTVYSFVPTSNDVDGDTLTFTISGKPGWASFDSNTGALTGTASAVGTTSNIVITVGDGALTKSLAAFDLTVESGNDAPTITGAPATTVTEGSSYLFTPVASDVDSSSLTFSIVNKPTWASFNPNTGTLSGTPQNDHVGVSSGIVISVSDGSLSASLPAFSLTVSNVNDEPTISGTPATSVTLGESYRFTPVASDVDSGDKLTFSINHKPAWAKFNNHTGSLSGTPGEGDVGTTSGIIISVTDDQVTVSLPAFSIQVNEALRAVDDSYTLEANDEGVYSLAVLENDRGIQQGSQSRITWVTTDTGLASISGSDIVLTTDATGAIALKYGLSNDKGELVIGSVAVLITAANNAGPKITAPPAVEINATGLFTRVQLGSAVAFDAAEEPLPVFIQDGRKPFFAPGVHAVFWCTKDEEGNEAKAEQTVTVHPLVSIAKDSHTTEGTQHRVPVFLNGEAPVYPVVIPYTVSGSADSNDHGLQSSEVLITSGTQAEIVFDVFSDTQEEGNETLIISLDNSLNLGSKSQYILTINEQNVLPEVSVTTVQDGEQRSTLESRGGLVSVTAEVTDASAGDIHSYRWINDHAALANVSQDAHIFSFSPNDVSSGMYKLGLEVSNSRGLSVMKDIYLEIRPQLTALDSTDSDGDLIPDDMEGHNDTDGDGIPDYQDAISDCNVIQEQAVESAQYLVEGQPGACLRKGIARVDNQTGGAQLMADELVEDTGGQNIGGIFDFMVYDLPVAGQSYQLVFPQRLPVPAQAVYRKYRASTGWGDFVIDEYNQIASAQGEAGYCPPPGDASWQTGLREGHWCVQLTIEDGGPNDDDGMANSTIVDPGGVATTSSNHLPIANDDSVTIEIGETAQIDVLANDSDVDNDTLSISHASADIGTATVENGFITYQPAETFYGVDTIRYSISDGNGGTAYAEVQVSVTEAADVEANERKSRGASLSEGLLLLLGVFGLMRWYQRRVSYRQ